MRLGALVIVIACAACDSRYGAYLTVSGSGSAMAFDELDFYVGLHGGTAVPTSPLHPALLASTDHQARYKRTLVASDEWLDPAGNARDTYTYYLPANTIDATLGSYVLVVASRTGVPVGIGEYQTFMVSSTEVDEYRIDLAPWSDDAEQWGGDHQTDCVRWQRMRPGDTTPSTFAVVTDGDRDCDGFEDANDCNELQYCDATHLDGCTGGSCIVGVTSNCAIAACFNDPTMPATTPMTCGGAIETCVYPGACGACAGITDYDTRLQCAVTSNAIVGQGQVPVMQADNSLCVSPTTFVSTTPTCTNPKIESPPNGLTADGFQYRISESAGACTFTITAPGPGVAFAANYVLISADDATGPYQRTSYGFELVPMPALDCTGAQPINPVYGVGAVCN